MKPIMIPELNEQDDGMISDIEIPSISFDDMPLDGYNLSTSAGDHVVDDSSGPLYPGATITTFQATSILTSWFSLYPGVTKSAFKYLHKHILPVGSNLPESYRNAHKSVNSFLTPVKEYHCCVNNCVVYRNSASGMYDDLDACPKCSESRYKDSNGKIPRRRFNHLPLELRLRRLFGHKTTSQLLQQHSECRGTTPTSVSNLHESIAWKEWFDPKGTFQGQQQGVAFGICLDGVNPYSKEHTCYSMWPIVWFPLTLPESMRRS